MRGVVEQYGVEPANCIDYGRVSLAAYRDGGIMYTDPESITTLALEHATGFAGISTLNLVSIEDYNALMGKNETLAEDEVLLFINRAEYKQDTLSFQNGKTYRVRGVVDSFVYSEEAQMSILSSMTLLVPDLKAAVEDIGLLGEGSSEPEFRWSYGFDTDIAEEERIELCYKLRGLLWSEEVQAQYGFPCEIESRAMERAEYYALNGGLFYLGILLSIVFVFAAVLIIYYRQISEGYEDQRRFEIMQKVGMTRREIRRSINSQLLTVFFLPLAGAGLHLACAFPAICQLLLIFNLDNVKLFAATAVIGFLIFAVFYTLVYRITSNAYYRIVSGM